MLLRVFFSLRIKIYLAAYSHLVFTEGKVLSNILRLHRGDVDLPSSHPQAEEEARRNRLMRDMAQLRLQVRPAVGFIFNFH